MNRRERDKNNSRSKQQQVDVFEDISSEATKDNTVTKEKESEDKRKRLEEDMKLGNDPVDW